MNEYLTDYLSAKSAGLQAALATLLAQSTSGSYPLTEPEVAERLAQSTTAPQTHVDDSITTVDGYNTVLTSVAGDLGSLFAESNSLWNLLLQADTLSQADLTTLLAAIADLEARVSQTLAISTGLTPYTSNVLETFGPGAGIEKDPKYYEGNTIEQAEIDNRDGFLKLATHGEFAIVNSAEPTAVQVYLDRAYGTSVGTDHLPGEAMNGQPGAYWAEILHAPSPLYASSVPWIPSGYTGGAAVRLRCEFDRSERLSEIFIKPFGRTPETLLSLAYTDDSVNLFSTLVNLENPWSILTTSFGQTSTGVGTFLAGFGPGGVNAVQLSTTTGSGACYLAHGAVAISGVGVEISALVRVQNPTPIEFVVTCLAGGTTLSDKIETIEVDTLGWTRVIRTFDLAPGTTAIKVRWGLPPTLMRGATIWIAEPGAEPLTEVTINQELSVPTTIYLPESILARHLYLTFSQPNYTFKHYTQSAYETLPGAGAARLRRKVNTPPEILDYDSACSRYGKTPGIAPGSQTAVGDLLRSTTGTGWQTLQSLEDQAAEDTETVDIVGFEYVIGASTIEPRHREYASTSRYVSLPIPFPGEIREITLQAEERSIPPSGTVVYSILAHKDDAPEQAIPLANQAIASGIGQPRLRFVPNTESAARTPGTNDVVISVQHRRERLRGTDRYGRVMLSDYPYTNRETIATLLKTLSLGASGQQIPFEPNALTLKYVDIYGTLQTQPGYRPVAITLEFDDGTMALPDLLGAPFPGELRYIAREVLQPSSTSVTETSQAATLQSSVTNSQSQSALYSQSRPLSTYATRFRNLASSITGIPIALSWASSIGASGDLAISPARVQVNAESGILTLLDTPPTSGYDSVVASYWYEVGEDSLREPFFYTPTSSGGVTGNTSQHYPVTRNRTDYMTGIPPTLRLPSLDPLDANYYPVYEYYLLPDGRPVFAQDFLPYGANPTWITVEYDTMGLTPRVMIDLTRPTDTSQTPYVNSYHLLCNVKQL